MLGSRVSKSRGTRMEDKMKEHSEVNVRFQALPRKSLSLPSSYDIGIKVLEDC